MASLQRDERDMTRKRTVDLDSSNLPPRRARTPVHHGALERSGPRHANGQRPKTRRQPATRRTPFSEVAGRVQNAIFGMVQLESLEHRAEVARIQMHATNLNPFITRGSPAVRRAAESLGGVSLHATLSAISVICRMAVSATAKANCTNEWNCRRAVSHESHRSRFSGRSRMPIN